MTKPIVQYTGEGCFIKVGTSAFVITLDHPHTKNYIDRVVQTSEVISHNKVTGDFETLNTKYVKAKKP